jgi:hypothetical protein
MKRRDWNPKKPYDLRERLFEFGCLVIRLAPANYEESDDASGSRDKAAKRRIALRELSCSL